jgi:hypothetical protein
MTTPWQLHNDSFVCVICRIPKFKPTLSNTHATHLSLRVFLTLIIILNIKRVLNTSLCIRMMGKFIIINEIAGFACLNFFWTNNSIQCVD